MKPTLPKDRLSRHPFVGLVNVVLSNRKPHKVTGFCGFYEVDTHDIKFYDIKKIAMETETDIYVMGTEKGFHFVTLKPMTLLQYSKWFSMFREKMPSDYTFGDKSKTLKSRFGNLPYTCLRTTPKHNNQISFYGVFRGGIPHEISRYHMECYRHIIPYKVVTGKLKNTLGIQVIRWGKT